jgi:hypothetical protein
VFASWSASPSVPHPFSGRREHPHGASLVARQPQRLGQGCGPGPQGVLPVGAVHQETLSPARPCHGEPAEGPAGAAQAVAALVNRRCGGQGAFLAAFSPCYCGVTIRRPPKPRVENPAAYWRKRRGRNREEAVGREKVTFPGGAVNENRGRQVVGLGAGRSAAGAAGGVSGGKGAGAGTAGAGITGGADGAGKEIVVLPKFNP